MDSVEADEQRRLYAIDATTDGLWDWDARTGQAFLSPQFYALSGYCPNEVVADIAFFQRIVHPDDWQAFLSSLSTTTGERGAHGSVDFRLVCGDGRVKWVEGRSQAIGHDPEGRPLRVIGTVRDISARVEARQALRESEALFRAVFENSLDAILLTTPDGGILAANVRAQQLFGYSADGLREVGRQGVVDTDDPRLAMALAQRESQGWFQGELTLIDHRGRRFAAEVSSSVFPGKDGRRMTSMMVRDLRERKCQDERLRLKAEVMGNMAEGVVLVSVASGDIVYANPKYQKMLGYEAGELIGRHVSVVNAGSDPLGVANDIIAELTRCGLWSGEVLNRRKDGREIWCHATISTFAHCHYGPVWVSVHSDITEARLAQRERDDALARLRQLSGHVHESIEAERKELARDVHDQLGATLAGIGMKLDRLGEDGGAAEAGFCSAIADIRGLVDEALRSAREICTRLRPPVLDDLGLFEACRWYVRDWSRRAGIRATLRLSGAPPQGDEQLVTDLFRILQELLTNVSRHAQASLVRISLSGGRKYLSLRVSDNGRGFDLADKDDRPHYGLLGVRERAQRHGGELLAASCVSGTRMEVRVPHLPAKRMDKRGRP